MERIEPNAYLNGYPCSVVAVACALGTMPQKTEEYMAQLKPDGYATLAVGNKFIRNNLEVKKRVDYKRGQRPKLKDLHITGKAIVCVYGHLVYVDQETYWSFFDNENDEVVAVWYLKEKTL